MKKQYIELRAREEKKLEAIKKLYEGMSVNRDGAEELSLTQAYLRDKSKIKGRLEILNELIKEV